MHSRYLRGFRNITAVLKDLVYLFEMTSDLLP